MNHHHHHHLLLHSPISRPRKLHCCMTFYMANFVCQIFSSVHSTSRSSDGTVSYYWRHWRTPANVNPAITQGWNGFRPSHAFSLTIRALYFIMESVRHFGIRPSFATTFRLVPYRFVYPRRLWERRPCCILSTQIYLPRCQISQRLQYFGPTKDKTC
jgi:hypothetical protein